MLNLGTMCTEEVVIKDNAADYFQQLLIEQVEWRPKIDGLSFESIEPHEVSWLERPFEENEIHKVMSVMVKDNIRSRRFLYWFLPIMLGRG